jgi:hypothetical protein
MPASTKGGIRLHLLDYSMMIGTKVVDLQWSELPFIQVWTAYYHSDHRPLIVIQHTHGYQIQPRDQSVLHGLQGLYTSSSGASTFARAGLPPSLDIALQFFQFKYSTSDERNDGGYLPQNRCQLSHALGIVSISIVWSTGASTHEG